MLPVIDIFAGPGGLGEGFAQAGARILLSAEMDPIACQTLTLRKFFHNFPRNNVPELYYKFIRGEISIDCLSDTFALEWQAATEAVANVELGTDDGNSEFYRKLDSLTDVNNDFILIGGPPCQAYSLAGRSRLLGTGKMANQMSVAAQKVTQQRLAETFYRDKRHTLYLEYLKLLCRYQPTIFVLENVKGMTSAKSGLNKASGSIFANITEGLRNPYEATKFETRAGQVPLGYKLYSLLDSQSNDLLTEELQTPADSIVKAEEYGVPQARHRIIIVGVRSDKEYRPTPLNKSNHRISIKDAIFKLPKLRSGLSKEKDSAQNWKSSIVQQASDVLLNATTFDDRIRKNLKSIEELDPLLTRGSKFIAADNQNVAMVSEQLNKLILDTRLGGTIQHETRSHIKSDLLRYFFCAVFGEEYGRSPKLTDWQGHLNKLRPSHSNVSLEGDQLLTTTHNDRFKVQLWDTPSSTIVSHISKDGHYFIHPDPVQCRSLTVREAARLQTFPDNYFFCGGRTKQYQQVGNAVPVLLALQIAETLKEMRLG